MDILEWAPYTVLLVPLSMFAIAIHQAWFSTEAKIYSLGYGDELDGLPREEWESERLQRHYDSGRKAAKQMLAERADRLKTKIDRERLKENRR